MQRLHRNLGHPKPEALVELLQSRGASDQVIEAARHFQCTACLRYKRPNQVAPSALRHQAREVGERLQADVLWIKCNASEKKFPVLSVIDQATSTLLPRYFMVNVEIISYMGLSVPGSDTLVFHNASVLTKDAAGLAKR